MGGGGEKNEGLEFWDMEITKEGGKKNRSLGFWEGGVG